MAQKDPLLDSINAVIKENNTRRRVEAELNTELGIYNRKQLVREMGADYDDILNKRIADALVDKKNLTEEQLDERFGGARATPTGLVKPVATNTKKSALGSKTPMPRPVAAPPTTPAPSSSVPLGRARSSLMSTPATSSTTERPVSPPSGVRLRNLGRNIKPQANDPPAPAPSSATAAPVTLPPTATSSPAPAPAPTPAAPAPTPAPTAAAPAPTPAAEPIARQARQPSPQTVPTPRATAPAARPQARPQPQRQAPPPKKEKPMDYSMGERGRNSGTASDFYEERRFLARKLKMKGR